MLAMSARERTWRTGSARGVAAGLLASALAHAGVYVLLRWSSTMPAVDFELTLPSEVEFGLTEAAAVAPAPPPPPAPAQVPSAAPAEIAAGEKPKPKPKAEPRDGGVADAGDAPLTEVAQGEPQRSDAGLPSGDAKGGALAAFAPKGAQIALRVHMGRVRQSPLAEDVRNLLDAVPDWRLVLGGSGLDPLRDLERLYLATPDLRRSNLVIAGEYVGSAELPRAAVAALAAARGRAAPWSKRGGIAVAPWLNEDETERVVALIAPQQFAITRPDDLPRVLLVARALAARKKEKAGTTAEETEAGQGDALLALDEQQSFAVSIEGARMFARGNIRGVPERLELSVSLQENGEYAVQASGFFENSRAAESARDYWQNVRDQFASHPLVSLIGMRAPLTRSELRADESEVAFSTQVTVPQARVLLGFVRQALGRTAREPSIGATSPGAPAGPLRSAGGTVEPPTPDRPRSSEPRPTRPAGGVRVRVSPPGP
jgi:hypothetical protein